MPTIGSMTKTIRFNPSDLGLIEEVMRKEDTSFNNAVHLLIENGVHPKNESKSVKGTPEIEEKTTSRGTPNKDYESICEMASLMRVEPGVIIEQIKDLLESGELYVSGGRLVNPRYEDFESLCERKKLDADKIIEKVIREYGG